jgi:hypothetical protein
VKNLRNQRPPCRPSPVPSLHADLTPRVERHAADAHRDRVAIRVLHVECSRTELAGTRDLLSEETADGRAPKSSMFMSTDQTLVKVPHHAVGTSRRRGPLDSQGARDGR